MIIDVCHSLLAKAIRSSNPAKPQVQAAACRARRWSVCGVETCDGRVPRSSDPTEMRFVGVSLDCAAPEELANFYLNLLSGRLLWSSDRSAGIQVPGLLMVMQQVADHEKPTWPGASIVHLDPTAGDHLGEPEQRALTLGAPAEPQPDARWRVLLDPAGHPFCMTTLAPPAEMLESVYGHQPTASAGIEGVPRSGSSDRLRDLRG